MRVGLLHRQLLQRGRVARGGIGQGYLQHHLSFPQVAVQLDLIGMRKQILSMCNTYMHTYTLTYIHTVHTYILTYIHTVHTYILKYIHSYKNMCIYIHTVHTYIQIFIQYIHTHIVHTYILAHLHTHMCYTYAQQ